jgi:redox-sensitive bicupin YhaK (pirin superfamily)
LGVALSSLGSSVSTVIVPRSRDLGGGFVVRRALPAVERQMVGPFIFFDQMGPTLLSAGQGLDVRPHPHIGLATVTYLLEGRILHRDSLGNVQEIVPGEINWMTAGRGIAHSERSPLEDRQRPQPISGFQIWVALPTQFEEVAPSFSHTSGSSLPVIEGDGARARVMVGGFEGVRSPVKTLSEMFYGDVTLSPGAVWKLHRDDDERAAYIISGEVELDGQVFSSGQMPVFAPGREVVIRSPGHSRLLVFGGEPMEGHRHMWWNFVSSSKERLEQARADWRERRFAEVPGETERIPLPEGP